MIRNAAPACRKPCPGEWTCNRCGNSLGAIREEDGWELYLPMSCISPKNCAAGMVALVEDDSGHA